MAHGNTRQPAPFRLIPLLAHQKSGEAGRANLMGWAQTHTPGPSIFNFFPIVINEYIAIIKTKNPI